MEKLASQHIGDTINLSTVGAFIFPPKFFRITLFKGTFFHSNNETKNLRDETENLLGENPQGGSQLRFNTTTTLPDEKPVLPSHCITVRNS